MKSVPNTVVEKPKRKLEWAKVKDSRSSIPKRIFIQDKIKESTEITHTATIYKDNGSHFLRQVH